MTGSSTTQGAKTLLHPVSDVEKATAVYTALLCVAPQVADAYYVGFEAEGQHIGLVPGGRAAGHDLTRGLLARVGHRGEAG